MTDASPRSTQAPFPARGLIAVDKMGGKVIFIDPDTSATTQVLDGFARVPHELLVLPESAIACVPIYGDGIHGRNPHPGHLISVIDLDLRRHVADLDLSPYVSPHGLLLGPDGLIYVTCENSGVVALVDLAARAVVDAIETGSTNAHRLAFAPDGQKLYTENEEDATISVIDVPGRRLERQIAAPHALAGIAASPDGRLLVAVDDEKPVLLLIDAATLEIARTVALDGVPEPAQIARYSPDGEILLVTSLRSGTATLIDKAFTQQTTLTVGKQPMDGAFHENSLFVACQGDGSIHVIDLITRQVAQRFDAGVGCETLAFF
jgi:DNA-binding beta-propeller fold protein YncE